MGLDVEKGSHNHDKTTDHFVILVGMGCDSIGKFFLFHDNATSDPDVGTSDQNRLYCICGDYKIEGVADKKNSYFMGSENKSYRVTQIRKSRKI